MLLLSDLSNFREGSTLVREQEGLRLDIFRSFTSAKDTQGAIKALRRYGPDEPQLYVDALTYFASSPKILEEAGDELDAVLQRINQDGLLSPLQVIQALSNNAVVTMGRVKKYLSDNIDRERKEITTVSSLNMPPSAIPKLIRPSPEPPPHHKLQIRNRNQTTRTRPPNHPTSSLPIPPLPILRRNPRSTDSPLPLQAFLPRALSEQARRRRTVSRLRPDQCDPARHPATAG